VAWLMTGIVKQHQEKVAAIVFGRACDSADGQRQLAVTWALFCSPSAMVILGPCEWQTAKSLGRAEDWISAGPQQRLRSPSVPVHRPRSMFRARQRYVSQVILSFVTPAASSSLPRLVMLRTLDLFARHGRSGKEAQQAGKDKGNNNVCDCDDECEQQQACCAGHADGGHEPDRGCETP